MFSPRFVYGEGHMTMLCVNGGLQKYRGIRSVTWMDFYTCPRRILVVRCEYMSLRLGFVGYWGIFCAYLGIFTAVSHVYYHDRGSSCTLSGRYHHKLQFGSIGNLPLESAHSLYGLYCPFFDVSSTSL